MLVGLRLLLASARLHPTFMNRILWVTAIGAVAVYVCNPVYDPDLWWHITVGRWILSHFEFPSTDHWTMFARGEPWRAYSWSNEILFAAVDRQFGGHGLLSLQILVAILIVASFSYTLGRIARDYFFGAVLGVCVTLACLSYFTLRPQSFVWMLFSWVILAALRISSEGLSVRRSLCVLLLMAAWANTHLTTVLGLAVVAAWTFRSDRPRIAAVNVATALAGTLLTPYAGGEWVTFFDVWSHSVSHRAITEFQPATITQPSTGLLLLLVVTLAVFLHFRPRLFSPWKLCAAGAFVIGALAIMKFIPFATLVVAALLAEAWGTERDHAVAFGGLGDAIEHIRELFFRIPSQVLAFGFVALAIVNLRLLWQNPVHTTNAVMTAIDFAHEKRVPHPILNDFGSGGYLMYRYSDENGNLATPVAIDGRTNLISSNLWEKHLAAYFGTARWEDILGLVKPQTIVWRTDSAFTSLLASTGRWCVVFRSGPENHGYSVLVQREYLETNAQAFDAPRCDNR